MTTTALSAALDQRFPRDESDPAARARREQALAAFEASGYPNRRIEEWRYTDLRAIERADFGPAPASPTADAIEQARSALRELPYDPATRLAVYVDGAFVPSLSQLPDSLSADLQSSAQTAADRFVAPQPRHALVALNEAFARRSSLIADGAFNDGKPLVMAYVAVTPGVAAQIRLDLEARPGSAVRLVQHFLSARDAGPGWTNVVFDIDQRPGSEVDITRIQALSAEQSLTSLIRPALAEGAGLRIGSFDAGGSLVRSDVEAELRESGASVELYGLATAAAGQHVDNHICADHRAPDTRSKQAYRSIVDDRGRVVFNGKVIVRPDAQHIDARQRSDNLLLSKNAEVDTKPELEIYADDVRCSHGATVGELDANELFYLQSRGVPLDIARRLLTFGFANRVLMQVADDSLRRWLGNRLTGTLNELPELAELTGLSADSAEGAS